jgi:nitroreductase
MNETLRNIVERYSCRDFEATPLTDEQISLIVDAALAAPSAVNAQPWNITVVTDKALIEELDASGMEALAAEEDKTFYNSMMKRGGKMLYNAPCLLVVTCNDSKWGTLDSGILCQNIVLAAESLGLGSCIIGLLRVPLDGPRGEEFKKRLKFNEGYKFAVSVLVGTVKSGKKPHELDHSKVTYVKYTSL